MGAGAARGTVKALRAGLLLATLVLAGASSANTAAPERSTVDRPDEVTGRQVHPIYVVPKDGRDRRLDVDGTLHAALWASQDWLAGAAGGSSLRMDTFGGRFDISFLRSSRSAAELRDQHFRIVNALQGDLRSAGFTRDDKKVALVLYDGAMARDDGSTLCGVALGRDSLPRIALVNVGDPACGELAPSWRFAHRHKAIPHEVFHATGQVPDSALNEDGDGHSTDPKDIMYGHTLPARKVEALLVDPGHDDYWADVRPWLTRNHVALRIAIEGRGDVHAYVGPKRYRFPGCSRRCALWFRRGDRVLMVFVPRDRFSRFVRWRGACAGRIACVLSITGSRSVAVAFEEVGVLDVRARGPGLVRVAGHGACRSYCRYLYAPGSRARMVAVPRRGARFVRWSGGCAQRARCEVVVQRRRQRTFAAVFEKREP